MPRASSSGAWAGLDLQEAGWPPVCIRHRRVDGSWNDAGPAGPGTPPGQRRCPASAFADSCPGTGEHMPVPGRAGRPGGWEALGSGVGRWGGVLALASRNSPQELRVSVWQGRASQALLLACWVLRGAQRPGAVRTAWPLFSTPPGWLTHQAFSLLKVKTSRTCCLFFCVSASSGNLPPQGSWRGEDLGVPGSERKVARCEGSHVTWHLRGGTRLARTQGRAFLLLVDVASGVVAAKTRRPFSLRLPRSDMPEENRPVPEREPRHALVTVRVRPRVSRHFVTEGPRRGGGRRVPRLLVAPRRADAFPSPSFLSVANDGLSRTENATHPASSPSAPRLPRDREDGSEC